MGPRELAASHEGRIARAARDATARAGAQDSHPGHRASGPPTGDGHLPPRDWLRVPWRTRAFWATQALVLLIAGAHALVEMRGVLPHPALYFVPVSFFFIPVVYAATAFGSRGSIPTAIWCLVLTLPNAFVWHGGADRAGELFQASVIVIVAIFIGHRVDEQLRARRIAEEASEAWRVSEEKYRGLFEGAGEAVLVVEDGRRIVECNPAAARLLATPIAALRGALIEEALPPELATALARACTRPGRPGADIVLGGEHHEPVWVEPVCTAISGAPDVAQVVLRDVTVQKGRQHRLETFTSAVLHAQEEERSRIAHELHDETIQSLTQLYRMIDECGCAVAGDGQASKLRGHTERTMADIRRFVQGLRPPALDDLGLPEAIEKYLHDLGNRASLGVEFEVTGAPRRLSTASELVLFRIGQEALHNVERHASASGVSVRLDYEPDLVRLLVSDDGRGFDVAVAEGALDQHRLGLMGMNERARSMGGAVVIASEPGGGTVVTAEIPGRPRPAGLHTPA